MLYRETTVFAKQLHLRTIGRLPFLTDTLITLRFVLASLKTLFSIWTFMPTLLLNSAAKFFVAARVFLPFQLLLFRRQFFFAAPSII